MSEYQHHLLVMIESAQRAGCSEKEIVRLVREQGGGGPEELRIDDERRLVQRIRGRRRLPKAA